MTTATTHNILSVSEFTRVIKDTLETSIPQTWVRGEISNLRLQSSGHVYFTLKDAESQISCVLFKADAFRQTLQLKDGLQVILFGELSVYEPRGAYQIIARIVLSDGIGKLQAAFEELKQQLTNEGLFDPFKKRPIPSLPKTIGFITSPSGAAIHDFISILCRRQWKGTLILLPASVQGQDAPSSLLHQLHQANSLGIFDLLVIGRGGGSLEDLWCFNDPTLVRAVAASPTPIISAVGHEIDFTLCDFAADYRAETPSAAAELISSNYIQILHTIEKLSHRLHKASPFIHLQFLQLKLDDLSSRLHHSLEHFLFLKKNLLLSLSARLRTCNPLPHLGRIQHHVYQLSKRLKHASPTSILKRGFTFIQSAEGSYLTSKNDPPSSPSSFFIHFHDGSIKVNRTDA